jgi:hypothetical protein
VAVDDTAGRRARQGGAAEGPAKEWGGDPAHLAQVAGIVAGHHEPGATPAGERAAECRVDLEGDRKVAVTGDSAQAPDHKRQVGRVRLAQRSDLDRVGHRVLAVQRAQYDDNHLMAHRRALPGP